MKWITEVMADNARKRQKESIENFQNKLMSYDIPRRIRIDLFTPAEKAIYDAIQAVEDAGCDVRLTESINLLRKAQEKVADFVDGIND